MPPGLWRSRACPPPPPPPRWLGGRRPRRRLLLPPPPEGCPGPAFISFLLLRFPTSVMKGFRFRLPCAALGEAPHSRADFSMRGNPDAIGKILNDLFPFKRLEPVGAEGQHGKRGHWELLHATRAAQRVQVQSGGGFAQRCRPRPLTFAAQQAGRFLSRCSPARPTSAPATRAARPRSRLICSWAVNSLACDHAPASVRQHHPIDWWLPSFTTGQNAFKHFDHRLRRGQERDAIFQQQIAGAIQQGRCPSQSTSNPMSRVLSSVLRAAASTSVARKKFSIPSRNRSCSHRPARRRPGSVAVR
jgi:hypothetical protein